MTRRGKYINICICVREITSCYGIYILCSRCWRSNLFACKTSWPSAYESWHTLAILITRVSSRVSAGVLQTSQVHRWKRDVLATQYAVYFSLSDWLYHLIFLAVNPLIIFDIVSTRSPLFIMSEQSWAHRWSH